MEPLPLQAMPNEGSLQHPLLPTEGQVELSLSTWPSCWAVLAQGPGTDPLRSLSPGGGGERTHLLCCRRAGACSKTLHRVWWSQRNVATGANPCCSAPKAWPELYGSRVSPPGSRARELMGPTNAAFAAGPDCAPLL